MNDIVYKEEHLNSAIDLANHSLVTVKTDGYQSSDAVATAASFLEKILRDKNYSYTDFLLNLPFEMVEIQRFVENVVNFLNQSKTIFNDMENKTAESIDDSIDELYYEEIYTPILAPKEKVIELTDGTTITFDFYNQNDYQDYYYSEDPLNESSGIRTSYPSLGKYDEERDIVALSIRSSGCGATSPANVISYVLGEKHDPIELASVLASNGGLNGSGDTIHSNYPKILSEKYGVKVTPVYSMSEVQEALKNPNTAVIASCGSYFTNGGHLVSIMATDTENGKIYVADPNDRDDIEGGYDSLKGSHGSGWYDPNEVKHAFGSYYIVTKE